LPWSTCPIVPTFTCGLVRSNLPFAIASSPDQKSVASGLFKVSGGLLIRLPLAAGANLPKTDSLCSTFRVL
jgi:hypothetical protein